MATVQLILTVAPGSAWALWVQGICTFLLVLLTGIYAWMTFKMAKATERMATENERLRKEGEHAALRYLLQEAKMNSDLLYKHYEPALKGATVDRLPLVRFSVSGIEVMPKAMSYLGCIVETMLEYYLGMRRVNALIEEYYASSIHEDRYKRLLQTIPEELKKLLAGGKFKDSMGTITSALGARLPTLS